MKDSSYKNQSTKEDYTSKYASYVDDVTKYNDYFYIDERSSKKEILNFDDWMKKVEIRESMTFDDVDADYQGYLELVADVCGPYYAKMIAELSYEILWKVKNLN